jgi:hypothetical protein
LNWCDIGLADWLIDLDGADDMKRLVPAVLAMAQDPVAVRAKAAAARSFVVQRQARGDEPCAPKPCRLTRTIEEVLAVPTIHHVTPFHEQAAKINAPLHI